MDNTNATAVRPFTKHINELSDGYLSKTPLFQFIVISLIFPMWGAAASLNDILITQFKTVFQLNDASTAFVQSAFYGGYFLIAIPASIVIKKTSYKFAIMWQLIQCSWSLFLRLPSVCHSWKRHVIHSVQCLALRSWRMCV